MQKYMTMMKRRTETINRTFSTGPKDENKERDPVLTIEKKDRDH